MVSGTIFDIRRFSIHDGPGIRTTVFFKGCPLSCWWCHNPESQGSQPEVMLREQRCIRCGSCIEACAEGAISDRSNGSGPQPVVTDRNLCTRCGSCVEVCPVEAREIAGKALTVDQVMAEIERDITFFDESSGGVTFSGGEPLMQPQFLMELLRACRGIDVHTVLDTSGYTSWKMLSQIAPLVDLFLYDIKCIDSEKHRRFTGVPNDLILSNLEGLAQAGSALILRLPVIPGLNDDEANIRDVGKLASRLPGIRRVDLLPYHAAAVGKYERLGMRYALVDTPTPGEEEMNRLAGMLREYGLLVKIGG
jgi:pyruvate formate lyase activating enzyme